MGKTKHTKQSEHRTIRVGDDIITYDPTNTEQPVTVQSSNKTDNIRIEHRDNCDSEFTSTECDTECETESDCDHDHERKCRPCPTGPRGYPGRPGPTRANCCVR